MSNKILYVDDEANILTACKRSLGRKLDLTTTTSPKEALELLRTQGPFAVLLSDMRMPEMNGIELICAARKISPDTVYMMLTGNSDQETAVNAVNQGQIFRFMTKPCPQETLCVSLEAGIRQHKLETAEKELLQRTLTGSIRMLSDALALVHPEAFARGNRIMPIVKTLAQQMKLEHLWKYEIAAMLSQIGCIVLPPTTINKIFSGKPLNKDEQEMFQGHPEHGCKLLEHIPRMQPSANMIKHQLTRFEHTETLKQENIDADVIRGAQMIHVASAFEIKIREGLGRQVTTARLKEDKGDLDPGMLDILAKVAVPGIEDAMSGAVMDKSVWDLLPGMYAYENITTITHNLLVTKGSEITPAIIVRLKNFANGVGITEPFQVLVPDHLIEKAA